MKAVLVALCVLVAVASAQIYLPHTYGLGLGAHYAAPLAYHAAPIAHIQSGYVAATRGSLHTAPLPEGPFHASHHINTAPAPGTF